MNSPITIDGSPLSRSSAPRTNPPVRGPAYSVKKIATTIPSGSAIKVAKNTIASVPRIAGPIPPPAPVVLGDVVKNDQLTEASPLVTTDPTTAASTATASTAASTVSV